MCFRKYHVSFCIYCRSEFGEATRGELVPCSDYTRGQPGNTCPPYGHPMHGPVRRATICGRCQAYEVEVTALYNAAEAERRNRDEIRVARMSPRQLEDRRRQAVCDYRRWGPAQPRRREPDEPRHREPEQPRQTRGTAAREQEDAERNVEEKELYRYNRRREELRRREEQRRRSETRRHGYPASDERRRSDYC